MNDNCQPASSKYVIYCAKLTLIILLIISCLPYLSLAHGGGTPQLTNAEAGPYWISVWTQPDPVQTGDLHLTIAISEASKANTSTNEAGPPVLGAMVAVALKPSLDSTQSLMAVASHENAVNKLFYEADVELPEPGQWDVIITIEGQQGVGQASFAIDVLTSNTSNWALLIGGAVLLIIIIIVIIIIVGRLSTLEKG